MTVPNILTMIRLAVAWPLYICISLAEGWLALGIYGLGLMTDFLDGKIARATNTTTAFGRAMDSASDKVLVSAALLGLVAKQSLAPTICFAFIFRELAVLGLRAIKISENKTIGEINDRLGRIRFFIMHFGVVLLLMPSPNFRELAIGAVTLSLVMAYLVWGHYIFKSRRLLVAAMSS